MNTTTQARASAETTATRTPGYTIRGHAGQAVGFCLRADALSVEIFDEALDHVAGVFADYDVVQTGQWVYLLSESALPHQTEIRFEPVQ